MIIANIFFGLILIALGVLGLKFNYKIVNSFGRNNVFERKLGPGTTYPVFQLFAILLVLFGILTVFSLHDNLVRFLLSPLIKVFEQ